MRRFLFHSLFLLAAVMLAFFWTSSPILSVYTLQLIAVFIILFFINQLLIKKTHQTKSTAQNFHKINLTVDSVIFTLIVMLLVGSTGGLTSPLFFLIYFLMFGLALLFEPAITLSLAVIMIIFFLLTPNKQEPLAEALQLFSLILITPLALFFGNQYLKLLKSQEKIKILEDEKKIVEEQISQTETNTLLWTSLNLRKGLTEILDEVSNLLTDLGHLTLKQKEGLLKIRQKALELLKTGEKLKEEVDRATDE